ncbi:hypothetical protein ASF53_17480 [Methylobacterium sp. Leaf123]|uniref:hypothetical protein n=1 Tax=Methylobacterium sp. Leaf123 TaxID=1736264 RepID=UPI000701AA03|nr:hypothetical protein [Methylobacterium sp. Leaf123]KQQ30934.1 hypothetical protein ASF53_17480 [Methylobacterium sp. Leaf123]
MSFLLRAALVIGALSYLALQRQGGPDPARPHVAGAGIATGNVMDHLTTGGIGALVEAVNALPPEAREDMARTGANALIRQVGGRIAPPPPSADTLSASDRQPPWRGATSP